MRGSTAIAFAAALLLSLSPVLGAGPPVELTWRQLIPQATTPKPLKNLFARPDRGEEPPPPGDGSEGGWMSRKPQSAGPVDVVQELDGKVVKLGGYVVPLDFDATTVKEFLLVPYVGACIHVPPPPANQIVYVTSEKGFALKGLFAPVAVTGVMKAAFTPTGIADTGYSITADTIEDLR